MSDVAAGDIVSVTTPSGKREGLVVGSHVDFNGRHILEIQFEPGAFYNAWYPTVTRVRRTTYTVPSYAGAQRTIERRVYW
ncbi:hypothetical protein AURDEDRAFT_188227 [Auricularia subglabra TFB-10046 SS5]|uniref:Hypervirulence associated protein TUDOR domain-containing protein n=1 Tax=Auricularia subglabra (strain TFB-10046 / SS5) TaxID=717982 RepID=J0CZ92_AURST|nr:hypothetical protein AURDEDRAFT_188227 [Auricularia subglabra TFB-10046 SS5]